MTQRNRFSPFLNTYKHLLIFLPMGAAFAMYWAGVNPLNPDTYNYDPVRGFGLHGSFRGCVDSTFYRGDISTTDRFVFTFRHADTYHIHFKPDVNSGAKSLLPADFDITAAANEVPLRANLYGKAPTSSGWGWDVRYEKGERGRGRGGCGVG